MLRMLLLWETSAPMRGHGWRSQTARALTQVQHGAQNYCCRCTMHNSRFQPQHQALEVRPQRSVQQPSFHLQDEMISRHCHRPQTSRPSKCLQARTYRHRLREQHLCARKVAGAAQRLPVPWWKVGSLASTNQMATLSLIANVSMAPLAFGQKGVSGRRHHHRAGSSHQWKGLWAEWWHGWHLVA